MRLFLKIVLAAVLAVTAIGLASFLVNRANAPAQAQQDECSVANASGKAGGKRVKKAVTLETDAGSLNRTVNLGSDREEEAISLRVNVPKGLTKKKLVKRMELVAEPFTKVHETAEAAAITDVEFSKLNVSGDGKRITFYMCVDPPNNLDAGKYTSVVTLEGPRGVNPATMTITLNGKDGGGFLIALIVTAVLSFLVLLYKGASEMRAAAIAAAKKETDANKRKTAVENADKWWGHVGKCVTSPGWLVPTFAAIGAAFAILWAAYDGNPAWGESGPVTSGLALLGAGLAAIGAKTIFTPGGGTS
jgi:uncharacterized protein YpmB